MSEKRSTESTKTKLNVLDFFSRGPCRQRLPGIGFKDKRRKARLTTCSECSGIMRVGDCARDNVRKSLSE